MCFDPWPLCLVAVIWQRGNDKYSSSISVILLCKGGRRCLLCSVPVFHANRKRGCEVDFDLHEDFV